MNEEKIDTLMKEHSALLFRLAYYYTKNLHTAEDIVQDVFIKYFHKGVALEGEAAQRYLIKMTVNRAKDYLKSWHYQKLLLQEKWFSKKNVTPIDKLVVRDEEQMISEAILGLPIKQREVIAHYYLEGFTVRETAELLQLAESTVKSRLVKGREQLKKNLHETEWEVLKDGEF
ncbi:RNA polymerase sigma factor [Bacillus ndiopicus]|uniref:RNA polymerase sigma factor n=1 Tax=Bacillus ndiopicus TaxID=1347368 RepID=UPI0005A5FE87|nr:sigma-70 family RNA polymerase sigma factor [Bacillus ndiopicus]